MAEKRRYGGEAAGSRARRRVGEPGRRGKVAGGPAFSASSRVGAGRRGGDDTEAMARTFAEAILLVDSLLDEGALTPVEARQLRVLCMWQKPPLAVLIGARARGGGARRDQRREGPWEGGTVAGRDRGREGGERAWEEGRVREQPAPRVINLCSCLELLCCVLVSSGAYGENSELFCSRCKELLDGRDV